LTQNGKQRFGQGDQPGDAGQHHEAHRHGEAQPDDPRPVALRRGEFISENGDENQIVDPENDLQNDQGRQTDPDRGSAIHSIMDIVPWNHEERGNAQGWLLRTGRRFFRWLLQLLGQRCQRAQLQMQRRLGQQVCAGRRGDEEKERHQHLVQTDSSPRVLKYSAEADEQTAHPRVVALVGPCRRV